ncbi:hypothetical protein RB653_007105 [Dictyostelium firmibasis]|uniref:Pre-rRNA-processing protein Ipi1 N-terminal domain-containing protein n=1 Tax=Dictyostelium firmibasis TaxID=79012 RepID=A0AAN7TMZ3_9MYCE
MGRSAPKKTLQPSLDFKVKKKKLGRKPLPNPNITVTTFKSKALNMPGQNLVEEKDDLVNHRNLTLKDLLTKLNHYNDQVKKDAVTGIRDLISKHPTVLFVHLGAIMNKLVEVINDLDKDVRHCVHNLLGTILPMLDEISISPFIPLFSVYINSGMTHLKTSVRLDSLRLLDIFIDHYPNLISRSCHQMIPNYIDLLKRVSGSATIATISTSTSSSATVPTGSVPISQQKKSSSSSSVALTSKASSLHTRVMILKSLFKLIKVLLNEPDLSFSLLLNRIHKQRENTQIIDGKMAIDCSLTYQAYNDRKVFTDLFSKFLVRNNEQQLPQQQLNSDGTVKSLFPTILETQEEVKQFSSTLLPILIDLWLELGPSNPGISFQVLEDLELVVSIIQLLVHCLKEKFSTTDFYEQLRKDYIKFFSVHFPFYVGSPSNPDSKEWIISCSINSLMTQTASHFLGYSPSINNVNETINGWYQPFLEFIEDALNGKLIDEKVEGTKGQIIKSHISNLLWIVKIILPILSSTQSESILNAFISFDEKCHPHSTPKKACVFFIKELIDIQSNPLLSNVKSFKNIIEWGLASLPKLLWKLGNSDNDTSLMIINILLSVGRDKSKIKHYDSIQNALVPFFFTISKPTPQHPNGKQIYGPFLSLPLNIQFLALNTLYYFSSLNKIMIRSLIAICRSNKSSPEIVSIILDLIHNLYLVGTLSLSHYIAFCIATTLSVTSKDNSNDIINNEESIKEQESIIKKLCWNISSLRLSNSIDSILEPMSEPFIIELKKISTNFQDNNNENSGDSLNYILSLILSCFTENNNEIREKEFKSLSNELITTVTNSIFIYIFQSIKFINSTSTKIYDLNIILKTIQLDNSNQMLINILNLISSKLNVGSNQVEKNNNNQYSILSLIELFKSKELYENFQLSNVKSVINSIVKKVEKSVSTQLSTEKQLLDKLLSEVKLLFNE